MAKGFRACREIEEEIENNFIPFLASRFVVSSPSYYSVAASPSRAIPLLSLGKFDSLHPSSTSVHAEETLPSPLCYDYPRRLWRQDYNTSKSKVSKSEVFRYAAYLFMRNRKKESAGSAEIAYQEGQSAGAEELAYQEASSLPAETLCG